MYAEVQFNQSENDYLLIAGQQIAVVAAVLQRRIHVRSCNSSTRDPGVVWYGLFCLQSHFSLRITQQVRTGLWQKYKHSPASHFDANEQSVTRPRFHPSSRNFEPDGYHRMCTSAVCVQAKDVSHIGNVPVIYTRTLHRAQRRQQPVLVLFGIPSPGVGDKSNICHGCWSSFGDVLYKSISFLTL